MPQDIIVTPPLIPGRNGGGNGTPENPFHSVAAAMARAKANGGGVVFVHGGHYIESVRLEDFGAEGQQMTVRGSGGRGGEVFIDSMLPEFLVPRSRGDHWFKVLPPRGPFRDEWVWGRQYPTKGSPDVGRVDAGAFLNVPEHTRLVAYDRGEDLRTPNQKWPDKANGTHGENRVWRFDHKEGEQEIYVPEDRGERPWFRPWVYMGPGIWFDDSAARRIHIRLAPTENNVPDWPDYDPETTDPNLVAFAMSRDGDHAILLKRANNLTFKNLTLRFGNPDTIRLNSCTNIVFDHCRIRSGPRAMFLVSDDGPNEDITLQHCEIDGGIPTWLFRSDRKDNYVFSTDRPALGTQRPIDQLEEDNLGYSTSGVQLSASSPDCHRTVVHHCEITNAHDSYVFGNEMEFHHNWVHNLNDDGIAVSGRANTRNAKIYCNVMTQCLTALSFAAKERLKSNYIYGNLLDLRLPTLGKRPTGEEPADEEAPVEDLHPSLRRGHFFKDGADERPIFLFHNTCLVYNPGALGDDPESLNDVGFAYNATVDTGAPRVSYNNIFVAAFTPATKLKAIALLPRDGFGPSNGNIYLRIPAEPLPPPEGEATIQDANFRVRHVVQGHPTDKPFADLDAYQHEYWPNDGAVEYEHDGQLVDPGFKSFNNANGRPRAGDDLRLRVTPQSPAKTTAVDLPQNLADMYTAATGEDPLDRGCYPSSGARLRVGVNERIVYPPTRSRSTHSDDIPDVFG